MKYIRKVIIDNFQSHEHTELNFDLGLNIIVGQSDKGKSAILRAIKWVLYNEPRGADFIRNGTNECSVTIVTGDDYTVTRRRKTNKNTYTVIKPDGEKLEFENFGNAVPLEVIEATGVKEIKLDTDTSAKLNLNEQLDPPFLLSETGTMRAKAIGRIVNTNIIDAAERDIMKDISNNNLVLKGYEKQLSEIEDELKQHSNIDVEEKIIKKIESQLAILDEINPKFEKIKELNDKIKLINNQIDKNVRVLSKLNSLSDLSDNYKELKEKSIYLQRLYSFSNKIAGINQSITKDTILLNNLKNLEKVSQNIKILDSKTILCGKMSKLSEQQNDIKSKVQKGSVYMEQLKIELKSKISQYISGLKQIGKCPTCFSDITKECLSKIIGELEGELNVN